MAGFDSLGPSMAQGVQTGMQIPSRFGAVNDSLKSLLTMMLQQKQLQDKYSALQQIAQTRGQYSMGAAGLRTQAAQQNQAARQQQAQGAAQQRMELSAPSRFKAMTGKNPMQATLDQQYPRTLNPMTWLGGTGKPQPTANQLRATMAAAGAMPKAVAEPVMPDVSPIAGDSGDPTLDAYTLEELTAEQQARTGSK